MVTVVLEEIGNWKEEEEEKEEEGEGCGVETEGVKRKTFWYRNV